MSVATDILLAPDVRPFAVAAAISGRWAPETIRKDLLRASDLLTERRQAGGQHLVDLVARDRDGVGVVGRDRSGCPGGAQRRRAQRTVGTHQVE